MLSISRIVITMILTRVTDGSSILRGQFIGKRNTVILKAYGSKCQRRCRIDVREAIRFCIAPGSLDIENLAVFVVVRSAAEIDPGDSR